LRGPLTRQQVQILMAGQRQELMAQIATSYYGQTGGSAGQTGYTQPHQGYAAQGAPPRPPGMPGAPPPLPEVPGATGYEAQTVPPPPNTGFQQGWTQQQTVPPGQVNFPPSQDTGATVIGLQGPPGFSGNRPPVESSVVQYFLPSNITNQQAIAGWEQQRGVRAQGFGGATMAYKPVLLSQAAVRYQDRKAQIYTARTYAFQIPDLDRAGIIDWESYQAAPMEARALSGEPFGQALFGDLPPGLSDSKRVATLKRDIIDMLYNTANLVIPFNPTLKVYGHPDEEFSVFQANVQQLAREKRDIEMDKLSEQYGKMMDKLEDRIRRKQLELRAEEQELKDRKREELFTTGEAVLSLFKGRTSYTLSRMSRASRYRKQTKEDLRESQVVIGDIEGQMGDLEGEYEQKLNAFNDRWARVASEMQEYVITPYKKDIQLEVFGLGWVPYWYMELNGQTVLLPAFG
jgi:hypothetical protein